MLDESYGDLQFTSVEWGQNEDGFFYNYNDIETHICSNQELGVDGPEGSKFMPTSKTSASVIKGM